MHKAQSPSTAPCNDSESVQLVRKLKKPWSENWSNTVEDETSKHVLNNVTDPGYNWLSRFVAEWVPQWKPKTTINSTEEDVMVIPPPAPELVPTEAILKMRCDPIHSFSSCAQHCFSLLPTPDSSEGVDMRSEMLPPAPPTLSQKWRLWGGSGGSGDRGRGGGRSNGGFVDSPPVGEGGFAMRKQDAIEFKSCLLNVCTQDYIVAPNLPGCINAQGYVSTTLVRGANQTVVPIDFYNPGRLTKYQRWGAVTLSRFLRPLARECDLSQPNANCEFANWNILGIILWTIPLVIPLAALTYCMADAFQVRVPTFPAKTLLTGLLRFLAIHARVLGNAIRARLLRGKARGRKSDIELSLIAG